MMVDASAYEVIMIVHELHQRGYEQLRLFPGISPNGMCWRWMIYPKVLMKDNSFEHQESHWHTLHLRQRRVYNIIRWATKMGLRRAPKIVNS